MYEEPEEPDINPLVDLVSKTAKPHKLLVDAETKRTGPFTHLPLALNHVGNYQNSFTDARGRTGRRYFNWNGSYVYEFPNGTKCYIWPTNRSAGEDQQWFMTLRGVRYPPKPDEPQDGMNHIRYKYNWCTVFEEISSSDIEKVKHSNRRRMRPESLWEREEREMAMFEAARDAYYRSITPPEYFVWSGPPSPESDEQAQAGDRETPKREIYSPVDPNSLPNRQTDFRRATTPESPTPLRVKLESPTPSVRVTRSRAKRSFTPDSDSDAEEETLRQEKIRKLEETIATSTQELEVLRSQSQRSQE